MTGKEILKKFLKFIHLKYNLNLPDFEVQIDGDFINLDEAFQQLLDKQEVDSVRKFIECFAPNKIGDQFIDDEYIPADRLEYIDFTTDNFIKRKRSFGFSDNQFGYLSLTELYSLVDGVSLDTASEEYKAFVDFVSSSLRTYDIQTLSQLYDYLNNRNENIELLFDNIAHT